MFTESKIIEGLDHFAFNCEDLVFVINRSELIEYCNSSMLQFVGREKDQVVGVSRLDLPVAPVSISEGLERGFFTGEQFAQNLRSVFEAEKPIAFEHNLVLHDRQICLDVHLSPVRNGGNCVQAVLGIARDITGRKQTEELIADSRHAWLQAVDGMPYPFAVVDANHKIKRLNQAMAKRLGSNVRDAIGFVCYESFHRTSDPPGFCPFLSGKRADAPPSEIFEHRNGNLLCSVTPLRDKEGRITGCLYFERQTLESERAADFKRSGEEYMRMLLKSSDYAVYVQDMDGKYVYFNSMPGDRVPLGLIGAGPFDFFEPMTASKIVGGVKEVMTRGTELAREVDFSWGDEVLRFFERITPVRDAMGRVKAVMTVSTKSAGFRRLDDQIGAPKTGVKELSGREREVLRLIARGLTSTQIAEALSISKRTAETHRTRIMQKLGLHKTSALVSYAAKSGMLE